MLALSVEPGGTGAVPLGRWKLGSRWLESCGATAELCGAAAVWRLSTLQLGLMHLKP